MEVVKVAATVAAAADKNAENSQKIRPVQGGPLIQT